MRPCLIILDFGTHTTPRVLHFSALVTLVLCLGLPMLDTVLVIAKTKGRNYVIRCYRGQIESTKNF